MQKKLHFWGIIDVWISLAGKDQVDYPYWREKKKKKEKKHFTRVSSFYEKERMKLYGEEMEQYRKNEMISIFVLVYYPYFEWSRC